MEITSRKYKVNTAWCQAASIASDLLAWLRLLALDGDLARAEPKTLRYRILHTAGKIAKGQRRRYLKIPQSWPWAQAIATAFTRILALPPP
ncbi:MAG: transposase [Streptosporangiaceae bacterium]